MLQKFIWWTGLSDFLVGAGTWAGAIGVAMAAQPVAAVSVAPALPVPPKPAPKGLKGPPPTS